MARVLVGAYITARAFAAGIQLNLSSLGVPYEGVGALSGGGGDTRLLVDYPPETQQEILDVLFKPNAGASLQYIKVEIGGDAQSTEGVEQTHERFRGDLNCTRGYEWWVLSEAKKRNPAIKTYGLSWGAPGWIGNGNYYSTDNINYHVDWVYCAQTEWGVPIDYLGIWNERGYNAAWIKQLRAVLDGEGLSNTRIVAADGGWEGIVGDMLSDPSLAAAIDIVGAHYPNSPPPADGVAGLNKSFWASEMWNLGQKDDWAGAGYLAADLSRHASYGLSTSIVWCLIYSWFPNLEYGFTDGTSNSGAGHSLMTAAEPWSGFYQVNAPLAAVAHWTQFAQRGWTFLSLNASRGIGPLPDGGSYATLVNTHTPAGELEFSIVAQTMQGATGPQTVTFGLGGLGGRALPAALHVWQSTQGALMVQQPDVPVLPDGSFSLTLPPSAMVSVTTTTGQGWVPPPSSPIPPSAPFPFPYAEDFDGYLDGAYARYWSDMGGVWVVEPLPAELLAAKPRRSGAGAGGVDKAYKQVVPIPPIPWATNPNPFTCVGNANPPTFGAAVPSWTDYAVSALGAIDPSAPSGSVNVTFQAPCSGGVSQRFSPIGGDLQSAPAALESAASSGSCLGFGGPDPIFSGATRVQLVPCGDAAPLWMWAGAPLLQLSSGGLCLDVLAQNRSVGARTIAWPCESPPGQNEQWTPEPLPRAGQPLSLVSNQTGFCVDLEPLAVPPPFIWMTIRMQSYATFSSPLPVGYSLYLYAGSPQGAWALGTDQGTLAQGSVPFAVVPGQWYNVSLAAQGSAVSATVNGALLTSQSGGGRGWGMVTLGSGWHGAWWDDVSIGNVTGV